MSNFKFSGLKVLIVDDNLTFLNLFVLFLKDLEIKHIQTSSNLEEGLNIFLNSNIDIVFLDINLEDSSQTGIDLAEKIRIRDAKVPIIFVTANFHEEYYVKCRHVYPNGFLSKELSRFKLAQTIDMAILQNISKKSADSKIERSQTFEKPNETPIFFKDEVFFFKIGDVYKSIDIEKIFFFFAKEKLTYAKVGKRNYPTSIQLKKLELELNSMFVRIHKSYLVNKKLIESINTKEGKVEIAGESLPIGHKYKNNLYETIRLLK